MTRNERTDDTRTDADTGDQPDPSRGVPLAVHADEPRPTISPAKLGEYLSFEQCSRYFAFKNAGVDRSEYHDGEEYTEAFRPLNPLLAKAGDDFEARVEEQFEPHVRNSESFDQDDCGDEGEEAEAETATDDDAGSADGDEGDTKTDDHAAVRAIITEAVMTPVADGIGDEFTSSDNTPNAAIKEAVGEPWMVLQPRLATTIGEWFVPGDADLLLIWPTESGAHVRVFDIKSSREEKTYQRVQTACYSTIIREEVLSEKPLMAGADGHADTSVGDTTGDGGAMATLRKLVSVDTGIITRKTELPEGSVAPGTLPWFDDQYYVDEVRRLCASDGELIDLWHTPFSDLEYTIEQKCGACPYNEACATDATEEASLRLLGVGQGTREKLQQEGVETLQDLAELCFGLRNKDWHPENYDDVPNAVFDRETYHALAADTVVGPQLPEIIYRAQSLLGSLNESGRNVHTGDAPWLPRSGYGTLPDDDPATGFTLEYERGSMIRIYLNVQRDHLRDTLIQVSGYVTADRADDSIPFSHLADAYPDEKAAIEQAERDLLHDAIESLFEAIDQIESALELEDTGQTNPLLHFYTFDSTEQEALDEALTRHDTPPVNTLQSLWERRAGADQPMRSTVRDDAHNRTAPKTPSRGLLHLYDHLPTEECVIARSEFTYEPEREEAPDLIDFAQSFGYRLFNRRLSCDSPSKTVTDFAGEPTDAAGPPLAPGEGADNRKQGRIGVRLRYGAEIPLGYLYSATGIIDDDWVDDLEDEYEDANYNINQFRYHDPDHQEYPIEAEDIEALGACFTATLAHVERSLFWKSAEVVNQKEPVDLDTVQDSLTADTSYTTPSLAEAAQDYLEMEYAEGRDETREGYRLPPKQRLVTGETIPVEITDVTDRTEHDGQAVATVTGNFAYDNRRFRFTRDDRRMIRRSIRQRGADGDDTSGGDWLVAHPFKADYDTADEIERAPAAILDQLSPESDGPDIRFTVLYDSYSSGFTEPHDTPALDPEEAGEDQPVFTENRYCYLEPRTDQLPADRQIKALETADQNALHSLLELIREGDTTTPTTPWFSTDELEDVAKWVNDTIDPDSLPSSQQRKAVTAGGPQIALVQGPPGTGKTGGTLGPALIARCIAAANSQDADRWAGIPGLNGLVVGPSNKAIDEVLRATAEVLSAHQSSDEPTPEISLYRIADDLPPDLEDAPVTKIDYTTADNETLDDLAAELGISDSTPDDGQFSIQSFTDGGTTAGEHTLIFATPNRAWQLVKTLLPGAPDPDEIAAKSLWQLVAVDEGSMLSVPQLILAGATMRPDGQLLVGGDQRQLPPVQRRDWGDEYRRSIRELAPHLSALKYLRFLRGEEDMLPEDAREAVEYHGEQSEIEIPRIPLDETYRFGSTTAHFLRDHVYAADGIPYTAPEDTDPITDTVSDSELANAVYDGDDIVVVTYDPETHAQMTNEQEAELITQLISALPTDITTGVVTPHNAQRGRIETALAEETNGERQTTVDTVGRFQGDETEVMFLSATVSDPEFISQESDFLLNLNRLNVSASRHKRQLVVVAARQIFEHIPEDTETYQSARLWKALGAATGAADPDCDPQWTDLIDLELPLYEPLTAEVYTLAGAADKIKGGGF